MDDPRPLTLVGTTSKDQHHGQMARGGACQAPQSAHRGRRNSRSSQPS